MSLPEKMFAVQLTHHGGPESLRLGQVPMPQVSDDQILVKVLAAGVNNTDINTRIGWYATDALTNEEDKDGGWSGSIQFPRIQGADICGEVVAMGVNVAGFTLGQRVTCAAMIPRPTAENPVRCLVTGSEIDGGFAQYCVLEARDVYDVSASPLSAVEIAALPCAFSTAENMLMRADIAAGNKVLITGASGGVGMAAVQLAKIRGAEVTAICAASKSQSVLNAGADHVLDRADPIPVSTFDVVIDVVAGPAWPNLIAGLKPGGKYAAAGAIGGPIVEADLRNIYLRDLTLLGCTYQPPEVFERIVMLANTGQLKPLISNTYSLHDIAVAQADFETKTYPGKLVLIPEHEAPE